MNALTPESPDKDVLPLADALRPALLKASRALRRESQRAGVSALDAQLLGGVKKNPGIGVSALAEREQMTRASMSGHVKRLEAAGWIEQYRRFWEERLDRLDDYLRELQSQEDLTTESQRPQRKAHGEKEDGEKKS